MIFSKCIEPELDVTDKDRPVYICGTSPDLKKLPLTFWKDNDIIGMNRIYLCDNAKGNLDYWIAYDAALPFVDFFREDRGAVKFIPHSYHIDGRMPANIYNAFFYNPRGFPIQRDFRLGIAGLGYTVIGAISLAYALGYKDVRMRGIRFGADGGSVHFNSGVGEQKLAFIDSMESIYSEQHKLIRGQVLPELDRVGVRLTNETPGAPPFR